MSCVILYYNSALDTFTDVELTHSATHLQYARRSTSLEPEVQMWNWRHDMTVFSRVAQTVGEDDRVVSLQIKQRNIILQM